jgi:hypothetical protein
MIFYIFLGLVVLCAGWGFARSATFKQVMRGRGADAGRYGTGWDHLGDYGAQPGWNDDGDGGVRESRRGFRPSRHPDEAPRYAAAEVGGGEVGSSRWPA